MKEELLKNPQPTALGLKNMHADLLKQVIIKTVQYHLQKDLGFFRHKTAKIFS